MRILSEKQIVTAQWQMLHGNMICISMSNNQAKHFRIHKPGLHLFVSLHSNETFLFFLKLAGGEGTNYKLGHGAVFAALDGGKFGLASQILKQIVDDDASKESTPEKGGREIEDGDDGIEDDDDEEDLAAMLMGMSNRQFNPDRHLK